jgi:hypothetical protein
MIKWKHGVIASISRTCFLQWNLTRLRTRQMISGVVPHKSLLIQIVSAARPNTLAHSIQKAASNSKRNSSRISVVTRPEVFIHNASLTCSSHETSPTRSRQYATGDGSNYTLSKISSICRQPAAMLPRQSPTYTSLSTASPWSSALPCESMQLRR